RMKPSATTPFDPAVVEAADRAVDRALADLLAPGRRPRAVVAAAPAGAGKSRLGGEAASRTRAPGPRVAGASPPPDEAACLVRRIWEVHARRAPGERVSFCPASTRCLPDGLRALPGVEEVAPRDANGRALVVATLAKLGDAFARGTLRPFDVLLLDEAYQA